MAKAWEKLEIDLDHPIGKVCSIGEFYGEKEGVEYKVYEQVKKFVEDFNRDAIVYDQKLKQVERIQGVIGNLKNEHELEIIVGKQITTKLEGLKEVFHQAYKATKATVWMNMMNKVENARKEAQSRTERLEARGKQHWYW